MERCGRIAVGAGSRRRLAMCRDLERIGQRAQEIDVIAGRVPPAVMPVRSDGIGIRHHRTGSLGGGVKTCATLDARAISAQPVE